MRAGDCVVIAPGAVHKLLQPGYRAARAALLLRARLLPRGHRPHRSLSLVRRLALRRARGGRAAALPAAASAAPAVVGIGEQSPAMFQDPSWQRLDSRDVRYIVAWDALRVRVAEGRGRRATWRRPRTPARACCSASATRARAQARPQDLPSPSRLRRGVPAPSARHYPWVTSYLTWNEANHRGQPTWNRPDVVGRYYDMLRSNCRSCTIVGPSVLDSTGDARLGAGRSSARRKHRVRIWALHNYIDANRFRTRGTRSLLRTRKTKAKIWFTETGGARAPRQRLADRVRRVQDARGQGDAAGARSSRALSRARPARLLLPLDRARARRDLGLRADRPPRPPAARLQGRADVHPPRRARRTASWPRGGRRSRREDARAGGRRARGRRRGLRQPRRDPRAGARPAARR